VHAATLRQSNAEVVDFRALSRVVENVTDTSGPHATRRARTKRGAPVALDDVARRAGAERVARHRFAEPARSRGTP